MRSVILSVSYFFIQATALASSNGLEIVEEPHQCGPIYRIEANLVTLLDPIVDSMAERGFAGQISIMNDGIIVYERETGFSDRRRSHHVSNETLFHTASITKYFTAALALSLVDDGIISLDGSIRPYVEGTEFAELDLTFLDLLAHRGGLGSTYAAEGIERVERALRALERTDRFPEDRGIFRYSSDGYDLLGIILERVTGHSIENLYHENLLTPACLENTLLWSEVDITDTRKIAQPLWNVPRRLRSRNYGLLTSGGLYSSAHDLVAWQYALNSGDILSNESLTEMFMPRDPMSLGQSTLGGFLVENTLLGETFTVRGTEDRGDNAILNEYRDCALVIAIVTSRGPDRRTGQPLFRDQLLNQIEPVLTGRCH